MLPQSLIKLLTHKCMLMKPHNMPFKQHRKSSCERAMVGNFRHSTKRRQRRLCVYCFCASHEAFCRKISAPRKEQLQSRRKLNSHSASPSSQGTGKRPKLDMIEDDLTSAANTKPPCFFAEAPSLNVLANASDLDIRIWAWDHELARWDFYCFCLTTDNGEVVKPPHAKPKMLL